MKESNDITTTQQEELDLSRVEEKQECVCSISVNDNCREKPTQPQQVNAITSVTQQLQIKDLLDVQKIAAEQDKDPVLSEVKRWLKDGKPEKLQRLRLPADMLTYWKQLKLITVKDGLLCKKWIKHDKESKEIEIERFLVLVPESLKETVLENHHCSLVNMHPGIENTCDLIRRKYYWPRMKDEVELYVKSCVTCGGCKQPHHYLKAPLRHVIVYEVNDAISIDHIIPSKEGVTPRRNWIILSITDVFSGYVVSLPCKTKCSEETIRLIQHRWCLKFGYPKEILADNDTSFTSEFFTEVCNYFKVKVTHGLPYICSSTSKAERSNKRINTALRVTLTDKQIKNWDLYLNFVSFALNGIKSRHTGFSANQIMFGRHLNTPLDLEYNGCPINLEGKASKNKTTAYQIYRTIRDIVVKARRNAALDFGYADSSYNKQVMGPFFNEGDWAFSLIECPRHKFSKRWQGPYQIIKKIDDHLYVIDLGPENKLVNISKLKPYVKSKYSPQPLNPEAQLFIPPSTVTPDVTTRDETAQERDGAEIAFLPPPEQDQRKDTTHRTPANPNSPPSPSPPTPIPSPPSSSPSPPPSPPTRSSDPSTSPTPSEPPSPSSPNQLPADDWVMIDEEDPIDPGTPPTQQRRYPTRNRRATSPLTVLGGGPQSYD